jgi:hypothetical protein
MAFFRDDEMLNALTADDRVEIFQQVLTGSSDISKVLLDDLIGSYSVDHLKVMEIEPGLDSKFDLLRSVRLESASLLSKSGFEYGLCLEWLKDFGDFDLVQVLEALVRVYLLPILHESVELCSLHCAVNPVRALKINGLHVSDYWDHPQSLTNLLTPRDVLVTGDQALTVATLIRDAKQILGKV